MALSRQPSSQQARLASVLLPYITNPTGVGVLIEASDINANPVHLAAPVPAGVASQARKWPAGKAVTVARSCEDPAVLDALSRDSRVTIQRTVAANEHTGLDTLRRLYTLSIKRDDAEMMGHVAKRLPISDLLAGAQPQMPTQVRAHFRLVAMEDAVGVRVQADPSRDELLEALRYPAAVVAGNALWRCLDGTAELSFAEALAAVPDEVLPAALGFTMSRPAVISEELASVFLDCCRKEPFTWAMYQTYSRSHFALERGQLSHEAAIVCIDAVTNGMGELNEALANWIGSRPLPATSHAAAVSLLTSWPLSLSRFVTKNSAQLTADLIDEAVATKHPEVLASIINHGVPDGTSWESVQILLGQTSTRALINFITGTYARKPQPGEIAEWAAAAEHRVELVNNVRWGWRPASEDSPWLDELIDALGEDLGTLALSNPAVASLVARRLNAAVGNDLVLWDAVVSMLDGLGHESIEFLVEALRLALDLPAQAAEVELVVEDDGQLALPH